ncbi:hypothetical protein AX16_008416 [Volvariella volvacea WC 439]|nr:hypothetical protein AX16_008416 [Volvariella volvacea WC 439]
MLLSALQRRAVGRAKSAVVLHRQSITGTLLDPVWKAGRSRYQRVAAAHGLSTSNRRWPSSWVMPDANSAAGLIDIELLDNKAPVEHIKARNCKVIGSYNWVGNEVPTIMVPGSPPRWLNKSLPFSVPADLESCVTDQNNAPQPNLGLLPLVLAVEKASEITRDHPFDWSSQDFVTDVSNLKRLFGWADGSVRKAFRISLQLAGERTVLMNNDWELHQLGRMGGNGYGRNLEIMATRMPTGCENARNHYRVVHYNLNDLNMTIQSEADGYDTGAQANWDTEEQDAKSLAAGDSRPEVIHGLTVIKGGFLVPQSNVFELKSKSINTSSKSRTSYLQLFLSHTHNLYVGLHQDGEFFEIQKINQDSPVMQLHHENMQPTLRRFRALLGHIQQLVIKYKQLTLIRLRDVPHLEVYTGTARDFFLPQDYLQKFNS